MNHRFIRYKDELQRLFIFQPMVQHHIPGKATTWIPWSNKMKRGSNTMNLTYMYIPTLSIVEYTNPKFSMIIYIIQNSHRHYIIPFKNKKHGFLCVFGGRFSPFRCVKVSQTSFVDTWHPPKRPSLLLQKLQHDPRHLPSRSHNPHGCWPHRTLWPTAELVRGGRKKMEWAQKRLEPQNGE